MGVIPGMPSCFNIWKAVNETNHINKEEKLYDHFNRSRERISQNIIKTLRDLLNLIKGIYKNPTTNIILSDKRLNTFLLRSGTKQRFSCRASLHFSGGLIQCDYARSQGHTRKKSQTVFMQRWYDYEYRKIPRNLQKSY